MTQSPFVATLPRIACVGHASLDHVFEIAAFPTAFTKTPAHAYDMRGGGMAFNAAVATARLGASVRLIGRVGDDPAAAFLRDRLVAEGMEHRGLETVPGAYTSVSTVVVDAQGQRQVFNHRGNAVARAQALDCRLLEGAQRVLVDPRWVAGAQAALIWAREHGVPSVLDADVSPQDDLRRLVPLVDWAVFSEPGLACFAPTLSTDKALRQALASGCRVAVVTLGEHGCRVACGGAFTDYPAPPVKARDSTAAGDVFHGALVLALAEQRGAEQALRFASAAAALKCARGQGALGAPTRESLKRWIASLATRFKPRFD